MIDTIDTIDTSTCNTNIRSRGWAFTINNWTKEDIDILEKEIIICDDWCWQSEIGESGTPHIQGCIKYKSARTFESMKKKFPKWHLERVKSWAASKKYCQKEDTRTGEEFSCKKFMNVVDPLEGKTPYKWQANVLSLIENKPDDRSIYWFFDQEGNKGKTSLAKSICLKDTSAIYLTGKASDMKYGVWKWLKDNPEKNLKVILIDLVRSLESYVSYQGIEEIKNGIFYNTKYESEMCIFNNPHVIIFANFSPNIDKLSIDRWEITEI